VSAILGLALPGLALYYVSAAFLEALHRPTVAFVAVLIGNLVNLGLNVVLVFGLGPLPALGAVGVAIATAITFALLAAGLGLYILLRLPRPGALRRRPRRRPAARTPVRAGPHRLRLRRLLPVRGRAPSR
jgi:multidrug resistance protein, MATE family